MVRLNDSLRSYGGLTVATKPDVYTVPQSALALGLTVKRVRQMIKEGKLKQYGTNPITIKQVDVLEMRTQRAERGIAPKGKPTQGETMLEVISNLNATFLKQIEAVTDSNRRNEENLIARINALEAENDSLRQSRERKWWKR